MLIKNGLINDAVHKAPYVADIRVTNGKIAAIQKGLKARTGEETLEASKLRVCPGFVEAHCHTGLLTHGIGYAGEDHNEYCDAVTPQLRAIDSFNPQDKCVACALAAGVTTIGTGPGSSNALGGTFIAVKTLGVCVDDMIVRESVAMKCAFGENPKNLYRGKSVTARMTVAAKLREALFLARSYMLRKDAADGKISKMPAFDMKLEALIPVLKGEIPLKAHCHRADDICTAIRIAREFGLKMTLEHCSEGHLLVEELVRAGFPVAIGPTPVHSGKPETANKTFATPGILAKAGLKVSIITDAPVIPQEYLTLCAGLAVKAGMDPFAAFQAITINPAAHLGIADRVGSIEVGKDADIVITDGDPLNSMTRIVFVMVNGKITDRMT